jgi:hypothetical protein
LKCGNIIKNGSPQGEPILSSASKMLMELAPVPFSGMVAAASPGQIPQLLLMSLYSLEYYYTVISLF